jgi:hypothetical protein
MFQLHGIPLAVRVAALTLTIAPLLAISADARGPGGGGGGGGGFHMGGGGFHMGGGTLGGGAFHMGGGAIHGVSTFRAMPRGVSVGHFASPHVGTHQFAIHHVATSHLTSTHVSSTNHIGVGERHPGNESLVSRSVRSTAHSSALRNNAFASLSHNGPKGALASATFHGRFAGQNWRNGGWWWHNRHPFIIVVGWFGPLWWPYAYWDFLDYVFWPYAYDVFWPYAYDDLYWGLYGPYAYPDPAYVSAPSGPGPAIRVARAARANAAGGEVCSDRAPALTDWPIEQISKAVEPDQTQQTALNDLKDATAKALDVLQGACPTDLPSTPTGRLGAMRNRVEVMLQAIGIVRPAMEQFYNSLSDEQKQRFNALAPQTPAARTSRVAARGPDITQVCGAQAAKGIEMPTQRIEQALHPTDAQRGALDALNDATMKAADLLKANCPANETLTPPGRIAAMEQRLDTTLQAIKTVQPALENFYGKLTDEQKARFNELRQSGA